MKSKKEKIFIDVICNVVMMCLIVVIVVPSFLLSCKKTIQTVNSEYNGTIYAGDKTSNYVSLMVNVYWGTEYVETMLDIFYKHNIKTTFFVGGTWVKENKELLKKMYDYGHEIASHGYSHKEHGKLGYDENYNEINKCHREVFDVLKINMNLFAPPGGSYNSQTTKAATDLGYNTIMWTRDTIDWRDHDTTLIYNRAVTNMSGGDLILMHPTANTVEALERIIEYCLNHSFEIVPVSTTLNL